MLYLNLCFFFSNPWSESSTRLGNLICSTALCISGSHSQSIQAKDSKAKCTQNANTERPYVTRNFLGYANMDMDMDMHRAFYGYCTKAEFLFGNLSFYHNLLISKQKTQFYQIWHSHVSNVKYTNTEYANTQIQSAQKAQQGYQIWHSRVSNVKYINTQIYKYANTQIQSA